jgi:hypothetical protein
VGGTARLHRDAESSGPCGQRKYLRTAIEAMGSRTDVSTNGMIAVGVSAGGFATLALTTDPPPGRRRDQHRRWPRFARRQSRDTRYRCDAGAGANIATAAIARQGARGICRLSLRKPAQGFCGLAKGSFRFPQRAPLDA